MAETDARRLLSALAGNSPAKEASNDATREMTGYRQCIDRAIAATEELDAATEYLAVADLEDLETAIDRAETDVSTRGEAGRKALRQLREFRRAAMD